MNNLFISYFSVLPLYGLLILIENIDSNFWFIYLLKAFFSLERKETQIKSKYRKVWVL